MTATILIGNSDNKLTQADWSEYVAQVDAFFKCSTAFKLYFRGGSSFGSPFQNAAWVAEFPDDLWPAVKESLKQIRKEKCQESVCVLLGPPLFL